MNNENLDGLFNDKDEYGGLNHKKFLFKILTNKSYFISDLFNSTSQFLAETHKEYTIDSDVRMKAETFLDYLISESKSSIYQMDNLISEVGNDVGDNSGKFN